MYIYTRRMRRRSLARCSGASAAAWYASASGPPVPLCLAWSEHGCVCMGARVCVAD